MTRTNKIAILGSNFEEITSSNPLPVSATFSGSVGSDGAIVDGASSTIRATVENYAGSNPLAVTLKDTSGNYVTASGGTQYTEGDTTSTITGGAVLAEGPSDTLTPLQVDASKHLQVDIAADSVGIGGGTQYTEGDTDATITGTAILWEDSADTLKTVNSTNRLPVSSAQSGAWNITNISGTVSLPTGAATAANQQTDALTDTELRATPVPVSGTVSIQEPLSIDDNGGSITVDGSVTVTQATASNLNAQVVGAVAHDAVDSGNPLKVGGKASTSAPTAVANGDRVNAYFDTNGRLAVFDGGGSLTVDASSLPLPTGASTSALQTTANGILTTIDSDTGILAGAVSGSEMQVDVVAALPAGTNALGKLLPPDIDVTTHSNYAKKYYTSTGAVTDGIVWSPAAGKRWHIVSLFINVSAAATVTLEDDKAAGDEVVWKAELAANSGAVFTFPEKYPLASGEDAADLIITTSAGNVYVTVVGYEV